MQSQLQQACTVESSTDRTPRTTAVVIGGQYGVLVPAQRHAFITDQYIQDTDSHLPPAGSKQHQQLE